MQTKRIKFLDLLNGDRQYVVPLWQRRYCWRKSDIVRLVDDLLAIAEAGEDASHYAGTLLTFREPERGGTAETSCIVDGQQRLTTVSILLASIAGKLEREGPCDSWTGEMVQRYLTNPPMYPEQPRKLKLQSADDDEYSAGLGGTPRGSGAVKQAWNHASCLVNDSDTKRLLDGLNHLEVVSIELEPPKDDPQQIFESLNATGRPLTESEKVKNWLLIGLPEGEQRELYDRYWRAIEDALDAHYSSDRIDNFLRDFMRWRTGKKLRTEETYEQIRRWALKDELAGDRPALCREFARLAKLYGVLTGTAGPHPDNRVETELRHLRALGIDVHRPLTLRLLDEASNEESTLVSNKDLARALAYISSWLTRLWLAGRPTNGTNTAIAELAHGPGPTAEDDYAEYWLERIIRLRHRRIGAPSDQQVREGIRTRKAYGGSATRSASAVLCALMEYEHPGEAPDRQRLTLEHVMPKTLTDEWKGDLGEDAEDVHRQYRDVLANLTLSGDVVNSKLGARPFAVKKDTYRNSAVGMTRHLAEEDKWNKDVLNRRADDLADRALERWPWPHEGTAGDEDLNALRWRIDEGEWQFERSRGQMLLNVVAALLSRHPANADKLQGEAQSSSIHPSSRYPPGSRNGSHIMRAVPGHPEWVMHPQAHDHESAARRCQRFGERCGVKVQVEILPEGADLTERFWRCLKETTGGVPGQTDRWRRGQQLTEPCNAFGDRIGLQVGDADSLWLFVRAGGDNAAANTARMRRLSHLIHREMADQWLSDDLESQSSDGRSLRVQREWNRDDEGEWAEACQWLQDQYERLRLILTGAEYEQRDEYMFG